MNWIDDHQKLYFSFSHSVLFFLAKHCAYALNMNVIEQRTFYYDYPVFFFFTLKFGT